MEEISYKEATEKLPSIAFMWCCDYNIFYIDNQNRIWFEPDNDDLDLMCWVEEDYTWVSESDMPCLINSNKKY